MTTCDRGVMSCFSVLQNGPGRKMGVVIQGTGRKRVRLKNEKRRDTPLILE